MSLKSYIRSLPRESRPAFAARCGASLSHIRFVGYGVKRCSADLAIAIERATSGAVRCEELRPDIDWSYLRGSATQPTEPEPVAVQGGEGA